MLLRLADPAARDGIRAEIAAHGLNAFGRVASWEAVRISTSPCSKEIGRTIADVAARRRCDPIDALCAILVADRGATLHSSPRWRSRMCAPSWHVRGCW